LFDIFGFLRKAKANYFLSICTIVILLKIKHFFTYPRRPQSNGAVERFNRTIQEQFVNWNKDILVDDINAFNKKLMEYLIWYNTKKTHRAINKLQPLT